MGNRNEITSSGRHDQLSEGDSLRALNLLEKPPAPNAKLLAAARALPKRTLVRQAPNPVS